MAKDSRLIIRVTAEQKLAYESSASVLGMSLSQWVTEMLAQSITAPQQAMLDAPPRKRIKTVQDAAKVVAELKPRAGVAHTPQEGVRFGKAWMSLGRMRSMHRRPDGTEYEAWVS